MALSFVDLLDQLPEERDGKNIRLNIPSLKRKCDLFYHLADKEAYHLLQTCHVQRFSPDLPIVEAVQNLCILLKGKVSLCCKTSLPTAAVDISEDHVKQEEKEDTKKSDPKKYENEKTAMNPNDRRNAVIDMVTALLEQRKSLIENEKNEKRRISVASLRSSKSYGNSSSDIKIKTIAHDTPFQLPINRQTLYGKPVVQYSDGSYFGGPDTPYTRDAAKHEKFVYVADKNCTILMITPKLQRTIVNSHYLNTIKMKEDFISGHHITSEISKQLQSALLHEMLEEHFVEGNFLFKKGEPADTVYLIKSGFVRISLEIKVPKLRLPEAIQHLPSTKMRQRPKTLSFDVIDVGAGEFIGGLEQLYGSPGYLFTVTATAETVAYNIRAEQFRDLLLKPNSKTLYLFKSEMRNKYRIRRQLMDFSHAPDINQMLTWLLGSDNEDEGSVAPQETVKSGKKQKEIPQFLLHGGGTDSMSEERQFTRPPNRGPFADRVRNRMIELGFKSRRGT